MRKIALTILTLFLPLAFGLSSCNEGPKEPEVIIPTIGKNGNWWIGENDTGISAIGKPGKDGKDGVDGQDGKDGVDGAPGKDGINGQDGKDGVDGKPGKDGVDGQDGQMPEFSVSTDGYWIINGVKTEVKTHGEDGKDGKTPEITINEYGYWTINGVPTKVYSKGEDGKDGHTPEVSINKDGYWVIDGIITEYKAEGDNDQLRKELSYTFDELEIFKVDKETVENPYFTYTTSTFSGWGGSIGKPELVDTICFKVRARDIPIQKMKFFISENDKNGAVLVEEEMAVNIPAKESRDVVWKLPKKLENNTKSLYFSYNCDQLCDVYSRFDKTAQIKQDEFQAVTTYITSGTILENPSKMVDVYNLPTYYLYAQLGHNETVFKLKEQYLNRINVNLPEEYSLAVDDNFQLFYRGVIQAVNPYNYAIEVLCNKGKAFPRYFEWTPTIQDIGRHYLTINVYDDNGYLLGTDTTWLKVSKPVQTNTKQNVLCFGDSLTSGGYWVGEAARRFTQTGRKIPGLGLDYLNFIGGKKINIGGREIGYEGTGGWTWDTYLSEQSPFYNPETKTIDFKYYANKINVETIDECFILLTWNGMGKAYDNSFSPTQGHLKTAQIILDQLHADFPYCKIRCMGLQMPSQNGGMGANYGANSGYGNSYGMLVTAMNYNVALEKMCLSNKYRDFVNYVDIAGQFDTDYNMPSTNKPVNNRNETTEVIGTNGVHPSMSGYYQIADAVYRKLCNDYEDKNLIK